ncbi:EF2563 family selenium-dependent molybdenum hydroxylase system protein [Crassaminicella thermophila]|uniref:EF2563 family selenium-dependent molybdenum hydroxylase system protein n=1 Tax=Crassaminicella thermophila TaxID=2599308 RepID=A0A5C0SF40_CRATE|nr:selenium-dependent molybdenum cofactor biosynthesis protein YqeB [Crassaminicella thermophila]QEK13063.1 EF2563 family selenium-dependent molybdenum hydroxylase system protein [Crassaminicella thermophila]
MFSKYIVIIKGGGDIATAVAYKLFRAGFKVIITELEKPMMVRRTVSFANCIYEKEWTVEGVTSAFAEKEKDIERILKSGKIPVFVDPACKILEKIQPTILIDAILAKKNCGTQITDAPIVIALGPGFTAGLDVDAVIETNRGHQLGRILFEGKADANTGVPGPIKGYTIERVLRAPCMGIVKNHVEIGDFINKGERICSVGDLVVNAEIDGVVRGLIKDGLFVKKNEKIGDIDPRKDKKYCSLISDKGRNVAGGVLEAILILLQRGQVYL